MNIVLTPEQELRAAREGFGRQSHAVEHAMTPRHRAGSLWGGHIEGACAELAAALTLGIPWTGEGFRVEPGVEHPPDAGERTEVRWVAPTRHPFLNYDAGRDHDDRFYVLVMGLAPTYEILGYKKGADCRYEAWKTIYPERTVYRVPAIELLPVERMSE